MKWKGFNNIKKKCKNAKNCKNTTDYHHTRLND